MDLARVSSAAGEKNTDNRQIVVVDLAEKQQGPVIVDLAIEHLGNAANRGQNIDVGGFEVLGAVRQFGDVALSVADDWQARWEIGAFVRQVDPNELDATLQSFNPTAAFQYDRQPWSLSLRLARRQLRVHVTPKFEMECLPEESRLTVKLNYQTFDRRSGRVGVARRHRPDIGYIRRHVAVAVSSSIGTPSGSIIFFTSAFGA